MAQSSSEIGTQNTQAILSSLLFSLFVGLLLYLLFEGCRGITAIYCKRVVSFAHRTPPKPPASLLGWVAPLLAVSDEETLRMVGLDAYVLLRFVYLCLRFSIFCTVLGLVVLVPVYAAGEEKTTLADMTLANTNSGSVRLWAPTVLAYVYSAYFIRLLQQEYKRFLVLRQEFLAHGDGDIPKQVSYTVMAENIPPEYREPVAFRAFFERLFPGQVFSTALCLDLRKLNTLVGARAACRDNLEKAIAFKEATGENPTIKTHSYATCTTTEEDAIDAYTHRLRGLNDEVSKLQEEYVKQLPQAEQYDSHAARTMGFLVSGVAGAVADVSGRLKRQKTTRTDSAPESVDRDVAAPPSEEGEEGSGKLGQARRLIGAVGNTAVGITGQFTKEALFGMKTVTSSALHGVTEVGRQLEMMTLGASYSIAATGFVTFSSRVAAAASYQMLLTPRTLRMELRPAFPPRDIVWENVAIPVEQMKSRGNMTTAWVVAGGIFWSLIVASIQAWTSAESLSKVFPSLGDYSDSSSFAILFGYLPVIALILLMQLLPLIFYYVALYYEGLKTHSEIDHYVMTRYFYFQVVNIYSTVMFGSVLQSLKKIVHEDFAGVVNELANSLPLVAVYFINLIIAQLFITLPLAMLRIYPLYQLALIRMFSDREKMTRRELRSGPFADPIIYYGWEYPNMLMVLMIVVTYMVISPVVCPFAVVYFGAAFLVYKYQLLYAYIPSRESGGKHFYSLFNRAMVVLMASVVTLIGYMILREGVSQAPCLVPLPIIIFYYWRKFDREYFAASRFLSLEKAVELDQEQNHGLENPEEADIASFDPQLFVQPTLIEPLQEPEEYRVQTHDATACTAEDIELSPPAMRASMCEAQESSARASVRARTSSQVERRQDDKV